MPFVAYCRMKAHGVFWLLSEAFLKVIAQLLDRHAISAFDGFTMSGSTLAPPHEIRWTLAGPAPRNHSRPRFLSLSLAFDRTQQLTTATNANMKRTAQN